MEPKMKKWFELGYWKEHKIPELLTFLTEIGGISPSEILITRSTLSRPEIYYYGDVQLDIDAWESDRAYRKEFPELAALLDKQKTKNI